VFCVNSLCCIFSFLNLSWNFIDYCNSLVFVLKAVSWILFAMQHLELPPAHHVTWVTEPINDSTQPTRVLKQCCIVCSFWCDWHKLADLFKWCFTVILENEEFFRCSYSRVCFACFQAAQCIHFMWLLNCVADCDGVLWWWLGFRYYEIQAENGTL